MFSTFLSRIFWSLSPEQSFETMRATALAEWQQRFERAADGDASALERCFRSQILDGTIRLTKDGTRDAHPAPLAELHVHSWAAFFAPEETYAFFFLETMRRSEAFSVLAAIEARKAASDFRTFKTLKKLLPEKQSPKPRLAAANGVNLRQEWLDCKPIMTSSSPAGEIHKALEGFSADDLHEISHGESLCDAFLIEAVAHHPLCDWGSACEILHSYSAAAYQHHWKEGQEEDNFSEDDQALFRAFSIISNRARSNGFATFMFDHNWRPGPAIYKDGSANEYHPENWVKWRIPQRFLQSTLRQKHKPAVFFDGGRILPSFDVWKQDPERHALPPNGVS